MPRCWLQVHPAVLVTAGLFCIVLFQCLSGLACALFATMLLILAMRLDAKGCLRLLRRSRWVALSIIVLFAWQTPGRAVMPLWWQWSPTIEGLQLALLHGARLAGMISVVACLMACLDAERWVTALYALMAPLRGLRIPTERFAVRVMLVLDALAERPRAKVPVWRELMRADDAAPHAVTNVWALRALSLSEAGWLVVLWLAGTGAGLWLALR